MNTGPTASTLAEHERICEVRHQAIDRRFDSVETRLDKLESKMDRILWFLITATVAIIVSGQI